MRTPILQLQSPQPPPIETVLATLLNELSGISGDVVLVLEAYHVIDASDIHSGVVFLLDHLPPHLLLASRIDPPVPLARFRARGELVEVRAPDLRFTPAKAAAYLNEVIGLDLGARDVGSAGGTHRRLDRGAPTRGAVDAGARRRLTKCAEQCRDA